MIQLFTMRNVAEAGLVMERLAQAGIEATRLDHTDVAALVGAGLQTAIYLNDARDLERARQILESWKEERASVDETILDRSAVSEDALRCHACGYDLRGHESEGRCPECGQIFRIVEDVPCPHCGETGPGEFDICWNCGKPTR